jgi:peptidoglycan/xylan/chitin deacetylase (PgdA/CDA1 family)
VLNPAELRRQLVEPKRVLEEHLGHPVVHLAYPSGKYNTATIVASKAAGYTTAVTVTNGLVHPASAPFELTRVRAHGADTIPALDAHMTPASWRR